MDYCNLLALRIPVPLQITLQNFLIFFLALCCIVVYCFSYPTGIPVKQSLTKDITMKTYSAQINAHGNIIVCGDTVTRNSYRIILTGTYQACLDFKANN